MLSLCTLILMPCSASADLRLFSIGAGDLSGSYFATARAICQTFNAADDTPRRCSPEPTAGSIYNLTMLRSGELDFALVQSDWQRAAFEGTGQFARLGPMTDLRSVISLYPEMVTILAAQGSGISTSSDLAGKTVDIGRPSSGRNATVQALLRKMGLDETFFGDIREYEPGHSISELCSGRIDAAIFVIGHPNNFISNALKECNLSMIELAGPYVDRIKNDEKDYEKVKINLNIYGMEYEEIESLAVVATLVTRASIERDLIADLVRVIQTDIHKIASSVPPLANLDWNLAAPRGMTAPLHPGAEEALNGPNDQTTKATAEP